jgi:tight adherence protein C
MELMILALLGVGAIGLVLYSLWPKDSDKADTVRRRAMGLSAEKVESGDDPDSLRRKAKAAARQTSLLEKAAPMLSRPVMPRSDEETSQIKIKLSNAGLRHESAVTTFVGSKVIGAMVFGGLGLFFAVTGGKAAMAIFSHFAIGAGVGFMLPEAWLWLARSQRIEAIRNGLPDALDLMVVSVEAGLGLDAALMRVGDEMQRVHMALAEELQICTVETQMGIHRAEALGNMATRAGVEEMNALVAVITQAEKLGTSVAKTLRTQADSLRTKRRQRAEERAQKTAVKLMLPLILFIFPAILVVLGAPAGIKLAEVMGTGGALGGG